MRSKMTTAKYRDQFCPCGATVTAKELRKGFRPFAEFTLIGYLDRITRATLCVSCQVKLESLFTKKK